MTNHPLIEKMAEKIKNSQNIIVFTGAGMSTESGIPDFRSKQGMYNQQPEKILSKEFFFTYPEMVYNFLFTKLYHKDVRPNRGHEILGEWEKKGKVSLTITQNVDGLHQEGGTKRIVEFHGSIKTASCCNPNCRKTYAMDEMIQRKEQDPLFFVCECGEKEEENETCFIKPDIVFYDEIGTWFYEDKMAILEEKIKKADLLIILGTTLQVYPFASLPKMRTPKTPILLINKGATTFDYENHVYKIEASIGGTLSLLDVYST